MLRCSLLLARFILLLIAICIASLAHATDSYLFERDGFRIHYVSNGGNCNGCEWIAIDGNIPPDAGELFGQYVIKHKFGDISFNIELNSTGGSLVGGIRLGRVIRSLGMRTSIGKTVQDGNWHTTVNGICYSACAYAFLGGINRSAEPGEYGVHQFYTDALLKDPDGKAFSPVDFSIQQTTTGLLLSYVLEMGASPELVVEANKTPPTEMNLLTDEMLAGFRVRFDPDSYGEWNLEAYHGGLVTYSRTQDDKSQMTIFCDASRVWLLVTYQTPVDARDEFRKTFNEIQRFEFLEREIRRGEIRLEDHATGVKLHVPLVPSDLDRLEREGDTASNGDFSRQVVAADGKPVRYELRAGTFAVHELEPRVYLGWIYEEVSLRNLSQNIRLVRRNCIN